MIPKLNDKPLYDITIPSTGEEHRFRPYLVKEEKILLMAFESDDRKTILKAIVDTIQACLDKELDVSKLTLYDVEYLFTKIRSKSVGESTEVRLACISCDEYNDVAVKLEEVKVSESTVKNTIELNPEITMVMRYPSYLSLLQKNEVIPDDATSTDVIFETIISCIEYVRTEDENIIFADEKEEDQKSFLDSLTSDQFVQIMNFVNNMPKLKHEVLFKCEHCGSENKSTLQGLEDFF